MYFASRYTAKQNSAVTGTSAGIAAWKHSDTNTIESICAYLSLKSNAFPSYILLSCRCVNAPSAKAKRENARAPALPSAVRGNTAAFTTSVNESVEETVWYQSTSKSSYGP